MKSLFSKSLATVALLWTEALYACPFCDAGGTETALFVVMIFGTFAAAALFIFLAFRKKGAFSEELKLESSVLRAENIDSPKGK